MEEQRQFVRLRAPVETTYTVLPDGRPQWTLTKDLGVGGCAPRHGQAARPRRAAADGPHPPWARAAGQRAVAEVVWSEQYEVIGKGERQRSVEVELQFVEIAPNDREAVMQHVILSLKPPAAAS